MRFLYLFAYIFLPFLLTAQIITTEPAVPTLDQPLTITFDATQGTGGLADCNCDVYLHTGVITNQSSGPSDWRYVPTQWGEANAAWRLTPVAGEANKYTYTFNPTVQGYFNPPAGETIEQVAFVFRNADGSLEGKGTGNTDLFVDIAAGGNQLSVSLLGDPGNQAWPLGVILPVSGGATQESTLVLFDNDVEVASFTGTSFSHDLVFTQSGSHTVRLEATTASGQTASSSFEVEAELTVAFTSPEEGVYRAAQGESFTVAGTSYIDAALSLNQDGNLLTSGNTSISTPVSFPDPGVFTLTLEANYQDETATDDLLVIVGEPNIANPPAEAINGITRTEDGLYLQLFAPGKQDVFVIGNFNNWAPTPATRMNRSEDGSTFWINLSNLPENIDVIFQYLVDFDIRVADPYSELVLDPNHDPFIGNVFPDIPAYPREQTSGIATWVRMNPPVYEWQVNDFTPVPADEQTVYELLVRDFLANHSYKSMIDTLDYLARLGITAIELMPVNEFEGNISWGYNPSFHLALDKYYGTPEDLKAFVDACHQRGISVLLDVVYNHAFSQSPLAQMWWNQTAFRPAPDNPYFNEVPRHPFNVGYDFNHESPATREYVKRAVAYWLEEFRFDGYRFDLTKGFTQRLSTDDGVFRQYDAERIAVLKEYADQAWASNPQAMVIFEHFAEASEENELAQYGNGIYFWSGYNPHNEYLEGAMGYPSNFRDALASSRGFTEGTPLVAYMESHDEERMMYKNTQFGNSSGSYNVQSFTTGLERIQLASAFFYTLPGPKMLWQFGELGYDFSINHCANGTVNNDCRTDPKPIRWDYRDDNDRRRVYNTKRALLHLRHNYGTFHTDNFTTDLASRAKRIHLLHPDFDAAIIGNFGVQQQSLSSPFPYAGTWYDYFSGESISVSDPSAAVNLAAGEFHVYLSEPIELPEQGLFVNTQEVVSAADLDMEVFPNPSTGDFRLDFGSRRSSATQIELCNLQGQILQRYDLGLLPAGQHRFTQNVHIPAGTYFLRLHTDGKVGTTKLVILP